MSLLWTLNRLRSMSPAEVIYRVAENRKKVTARRRLEGWRKYANTGAPPELPTLRGHVSAFPAQTRDEIGRTVEEVLGGRFSALGQEWPRRSPDNLFPADIWRLDPVTGGLWPGPERYCFDIPYRRESSGVGDVKYVWEFNRLQFLHSLAAWTLLSDDPKALRAIEAAIASWYLANPPFRGLAWGSGIELALRAVSLLVVCSLVGERLRPETIGQIRAILSASAFWLTRYPSLFSSANNHLIAECAGSFLISLAMPDLPKAAEINARARLTLQGEVVKQFHPDGVPGEQSPSYGAFSAELLLFCHSQAQLSLRAVERLESFAEFIHWISDESGRSPAIGDNDEGRVLAFAPVVERYPLTIARRIKSFGSPKGLRTFDKGGYSVVRDGRWHVVFDHGPLGYLSIAAHGHADALAIWVSLDGEPLLVDAGTYLYHSGGRERDWLRGTPAHNTLNIDAQDQSIISGPFNWSHKATCVLEEIRQGVHWRFTASHDGYKRRFGARHRRTISAQKDGFMIHDRLIGASHRSEIAFQFAPAYSITVEGEICRISRAGHQTASLFSDQPSGWFLEEGTTSPSFGVKRPAPRLVWRGIVTEDGVRTVFRSC